MGTWHSVARSVCPPSRLLNHHSNARPCLVPAATKLLSRPRAPSPAARASCARQADIWSNMQYSYDPFFLYPLGSLLADELRQLYFDATDTALIPNGEVLQAG